MDYKYELVIPNNDLPFKMFIFEGKDGNYRVANHWHRSLELFLVREGAIDFYMNSQYYPLKSGDFVIVNSNEVHSIHAPFPNLTLVLQIPLSSYEEYVDMQYVTFSKKDEVLNNRLAKMMVDMYREYDKKSYGYELEVKGLFLLLLHLLVTQFQDHESDQELIRQKRHLDQLSDITEYMKQNYDGELSLGMVAKEFGFSPTYLSRIFWRYAKVNYRTYLADLRVEFGVKELIGTDHAIGDIAVNHGFADSRAFAKAFLKRYGCLPSEYRKKVKLDTCR